VGEERSDVMGQRRCASKGVPHLDEQHIPKMEQRKHGLGGIPTFKPIKLTIEKGETAIENKKGDQLWDGSGSLKNP